MISIAIKTAEREPDYLNATLENLERGGVFDSYYLANLCVVDTTPSLMHRRIPNFLKGEHAFDIEAEGTRTLQQNAQRAIELAASVPCEYVLVLEDDIDVCEAFLESAYTWLTDHRDDRCGMYAFGANYKQVLNAVQAGETFWNYPMSAFYGAQACAWTRDNAVDLARWLGSDPEYDGERDHGHDLNLARWGASRGFLSFKASAPSFVQHMGEVSTINNPWFGFESWPGRDWSYLKYHTLIKGK